MEKIVNAAIFGTISVITLIGNILVVVLFVKRRDWLTKAHTCLLLALAIQDIITAIHLLVLPQFVPFLQTYYGELPASIKWKDLYCRLVWSSYVPFALSIVSIYTCLMLAFDRWYAVSKPLTYKSFCSSGKVITTMVIIPWIAGFGVEIGTALNAQSSRNENGSYVCKWSEVERSPQNMSIVLLLLIGKGILPAVLMSVLYWKMMITLKRSSLRISSTVTETNHANGSSNLSHHHQSKSYLALKRITQMACAASAIVVVCWLPDQIYYCIFELGFIQMDDSIHNGLHILAFANTCFNPFLYSFTNKQYREEFKLILRCVFNRNTRAQFEETYTDRNLEERNPES